MRENIFNRIAYRLWQFKQVLLPQLDQTEWQQALTDLHSDLAVKLQELKKSEKAHVLRVYMAIKQERALPESLKSELLRLALLHDIGKAVVPHGLVFKVMKVFCPIANTGHCIAGARFLRQKKVDRAIILKVLRHHDENSVDPVLRYFQEFDDRL